MSISDVAADMWHVEVDKRPLPSRIVRTIMSVIIAVISMGTAVSPSNTTWKIVETKTGRVLTTITDTFGAEVDLKVQLQSDLESLAPEEFARQWGFAAG